MSAVGERGRWIPWAFVGFFVGLFGLEAGFVTLAYRTSPGSVTSEPYATGLAYDHILDERAREAALRWTVKVGFAPAGSLAGRISVAVDDADGTPLADTHIRAVAERSTRFPQILPVDLLPHGPGRFAGQAALPLAGRWFLRLRIDRGGDHVYRLVEFTVLP